MRSFYLFWIWRKKVRFTFEVIIMTIEWLQNCSTPLEFQLLILIIIMQQLIQILF